MKKLFLFVALTAAISFCAATFNTFASSNDTTVTANAPIYWQGYACASINSHIYITVYQSAGQCNAYYAVVTKYQGCDIEPEEVWVKYDNSKGQYYVTFRGNDFYFSM